MYVVIAALLAFFVALPVSAQEVSLGISFPAPPQLVVVPEVQSVQYVPSADNNVFFYGGQYWAFVNGGWYYAGGYNGPWVMAQPAFVPQPLLIVPVTYYRRPPAAWGGWHPGVPPRWDTNYGRSWQGHREVFVAPHGQQPAVREQPHPQPARAGTVHEQPVKEGAVHEQPVRAGTVHEQPVKEEPHAQVKVQQHEPERAAPEHPEEHH